MADADIQEHQGSIADSISAAVEKIASEKQAAATAPATEPPKQEAPATETAPEIKQESKLAKRPTPAPATDVILPPKAVEPPKPEPSATDKQIEEGLAKPDKTDGIANLRNAYSQSKQTIADLQNQLEQLRKTPQVPEDYESLKKQVTEYSAELERVALERHPEFRKRFGQQIDNLNAQANKLAANLNSAVTPEEFTALLASPASDAKTARLNELLEGATPLVASRVANLVSNYEQIQDERTALLSKQSESLREFEMSRKAEQAKRSEQLRSGFKQVTADLSKEFEYLRNVEGNEEWNSLVNNLKQQAEHLYFNENDQSKVMRAAVMAPLAAVYQKAFQHTASELDKALAKLKAIEEAAPDFDGTKGGKPPKGDDWNPDKGFAENLSTIIAERSGTLANR